MRLDEASRLQNRLAGEPRSATAGLFFYAGRLRLAGSALAERSPLLQFYLPGGLYAPRSSRAFCRTCVTSSCVKRRVSFTLWTAPLATAMPEIAAAILGSGTSNMTKTPGPSAPVLYIDINLPPAASVSFFDRFVAIRCGIFHYSVESLWCVLSGEAEMHGDFPPVGSNP
jgi:hypothetical protein